MTSKEPLEVKNPTGRTGPRTAFSFSDDRSSAHHKSTASWTLYVLEEEFGGGVASNRDVGTVLEMRDVFMTVCTTKLVDKRPLTTWERSVLQAQTYYEADRHRTERSEGAIVGTYIPWLRRRCMVRHMMAGCTRPYGRSYKGYLTRTT
jgi:hypothetical protein